MGRLVTGLAASAAAIVLLPATGHAANSWDCKRVITPAEWRGVLGTSITVRDGESAQDCLWFHRNPAGAPSGGISGYPAIYRIWHRIYLDDKTQTKRIADSCNEVDGTRTLLRTFHGDFAWESEYSTYMIPGGESCPAARKLVGITRSVYVVHHHRLFKLSSSDDYYNAPHRLGASMAQLERLAHKGVRRF
jgi:hypothetical protein